MNKFELMEIKFLIRLFARYSGRTDAILKFRNRFGKTPTAAQLALSDLSIFLNDKSKHIRENHRMKLFKAERERYEASKKDMRMSSQAWRMEQYERLYDMAEERSRESGNTTRCTDILTLAAKDSAGFYQPKVQHVNIDNRKQTVKQNLTDEEINKRLSKWLHNRFGVQIKHMAVVNPNDKVIEGEVMRLAQGHREEVEEDVQEEPVNNEV